MRCKICGKRFKLQKENKYEVVIKPIGFDAISQRDKNFECFDCPNCGCQNVVNVKCKFGRECQESWFKAEYKDDDVLDKIRAEIEGLDYADYDYEGYYKAVTDALQIIDKYKAESEGKE